MKKKSTLNKFLVFGAFAFTFAFSNISTAQASLELSCRVKAKELAAETYKGCMTEGRQSQIEQIRKDYKEKLTDLKNHYDKELKKLSSNQENTSSENGSLKSKYEAKKADLKKSKQRLTGGRWLKNENKINIYYLVFNHFFIWLRQHDGRLHNQRHRSEEHTSELQSR